MSGLRMVMSSCRWESFGCRVHATGKRFRTRWVVIGSDAKIFSYLQFHDPALATALRRVGRPLNKRGPYSCNRLARSALFITKTQQQCFKIIQCLLSIGPDRLDDNTSAAIQIGAKDFQYARRRETFLVLANRDLALELYYALNKLRRGPRV